MGKKKNKRPNPKRKKTKNYGYKDSWISTKIEKGKLDILFSTRDILEELAKNEIYYYVNDYDKLIIVNVNDSKRLIEFSKRKGGVFTREEKEDLLSISGDLADGINLISKWKNNYAVLSSNNEDNLVSMWSKDFSYYPANGLFTDSYKPSHILLKLMSYPETSEAKEIFVLVEKNKAILAKIVQDVRTSVLYAEEEIDSEGILCFMNLISYTNSIKNPFVEHSSKILTSFLESKEISGRIQRNENNKQKAYSKFLEETSVEKLMEVVTAPKKKIKKDLEKEKDMVQESILKAAKRIFNNDNNKVSVNLSSILTKGKVPVGHGIVLIDTLDTFYPSFMKKVKNIFYAGNKLVVNIPDEKGIKNENVSNIFGIDASLITVFHTSKKEEEK